MIKRFTELWQELGARGNVNDEFGKLLVMYSEPQRFYHNMTHIENCLSEFDSVRKLIRQPNLVELALWYHDVIYDTRSKDSEAQSARFASDVCLRAQLPEKFSGGIENLILATRHDSIPEDMDARYLVDIDLSILGKSAGEFELYEKNIRGEYFWVPEDQFRESRRALLQAFSERDSIYLTDFFREKYGVNSRKNLQRSIGLLGKA